MPMTHGSAWAALILRLTLGAIYVMHAWLALSVLTPSGMASVILRMGVPASLLQVFVWYTIVAHAVGGALMIVGLWTRAAAVVNLPVMIVALALVHYPQGFFLTAVVADRAAGRLAVTGYEYALLVLAATAALALVGSGTFSIDHAMRGNPGRRR
jgi:putative oxidoreductase